MAFNSNPKIIKNKFSNIFKIQLKPRLLLSSLTDVTTLARFTIRLKVIQLLTVKIASTKCRMPLTAAIKTVRQIKLCREDAESRSFSLDHNKPFKKQTDFF